MNTVTTTYNKQIDKISIILKLDIPDNFEGTIDDLQKSIITDDEIKQYIQRYKKTHTTDLKTIELYPCGNEIELTYITKPQKFERIRRITGYLVGDMNRWNNAKFAEEHDRVKHSVIKKGDTYGKTSI